MKGTVKIENISAIWWMGCAENSRFNLRKFAEIKFENAENKLYIYRKYEEISK